MVFGEDCAVNHEDICGSFCVLGFFSLFDAIRVAICSLAHLGMYQGTRDFAL